MEFNITTSQWNKYLFNLDSIIALIICIEEFSVDDERDYIVKILEKVKSLTYASLDSMDPKDNPKELLEKYYSLYLSKLDKKSLVNIEYDKIRDWRLNLKITSKITDFKKTVVTFITRLVDFNLIVEKDSKFNDIIFTSNKIKNFLYQYISLKADWHADFFFFIYDNLVKKDERRKVKKGSIKWCEVVKENEYMYYNSMYFKIYIKSFNIEYRYYNTPRNIMQFKRMYIEDRKSKIIDILKRNYGNYILISDNTNALYFDSLYNHIHETRDIIF